MEKNILKLIQRYENKIDHLIEHKSKFNYEYLNGCTETYEGIIYDLKDLLNGIEMWIEYEKA